jgi:hypothetical protein
LKAYGGTEKGVLMTMKWEIDECRAAFGVFYRSGTLQEWPKGFMVVPADIEQ